MIYAHLVLMSFLALAGLVLGIPLVLSMGGGLLLGSIIASRNLKEVFVAAHRIETERSGPGKGLVTPPSAYRMYPLDRGWRALRSTPRHILIRSHQLAVRWIDRATSLRSLASERSWSVKGAVWPLIAGFYLAAVLQYLPHCVLALFFLLLFSILLLAWLFLALLEVSALTVLRLCYVKAGRIRCHCPACYKTMAIPTYLCPTCQAKHTHLQPGLSGVFFHRCLSCATALPTLDWIGRKRLARVCPSCHCVLGRYFGTGPEIHIALVGGSGAVKTSYLLTALEALRQQRPDGIKGTLTDTTQEQLLTKELRRLRAGQSPAGAASPVPRAWTLKMQLPRRLLPRLLSLYDPAEEAFTSSTNASRQEYYTFTDGMLFLIDLLALLPSQGIYQAANNSKRAPLVCMEIMHVYERMMQAFETLAGLHPKRRYPQPVAVVVTGLQSKTHGSGHPGTQESLANLSGPASSHTLRELLCSSGLDTFVRDLESHFASVQYFSCAVPESLHEQEDLQVAERLLRPLLWLCRLAQR